MKKRRLDGMQCKQVAKSLVGMSVALVLSAPNVHAKDVPLSDAKYPGTVVLDVDLRDTTRKIFTAHEVMPVSAGELTLRYPKWIPGEHSPSGTLASITGIRITANGKPLTWRRDLVDMYSLQVQVPEGVSEIALDFQYLSPTGGNYGGSASVTSQLAELEWNQVAFYPAGYKVGNISYRPSIRVPDGWQFATALEQEGDASNGVHFKPVSFEQLVDSPVFTGRYSKRIDLAPAAKVPVHLNVFADRASSLDIKASQVAQHVAMVKQAVALFGAQHYQHYDFLVAVSDDTGRFGLEHHQSSDDRLDADFFIDPALYEYGAGLLPHEYVHSWNGKFRRPEGLATPDYNEPMKGDLLWVYEGLTEYLGEVLTVRSGLWTPEQYRDHLAMTAANMDHVVGREWRSLQDTADEAQVLYETPSAWSSWRRKVDFYPEGALLWLDVDTRIRELSKGKRSLDDFARAFHGIQDGNMAVTPYSFDDVVATLNAIQPNDWRSFLRERLDSHGQHAPLDGISRGGWKLTYVNKPTDSFKAAEKQGKYVDRRFSLGLMISSDEGKSQVADVQWGSAAFEAGLIPGMELVAVNGEAYTASVLDDAITEAATTHKPIALLVKNASAYLTVQLNYFGGQQFPKLAKLDGQPDRLADIMAAKR